MDHHLRAELLAMVNADQQARQACTAHAGWEHVAQIDAWNTGRLQQILDAVGWPGKTLVGEDGAQAAWCLAQHADAEPEFQRHCLVLLSAAVAASDADPADEAYLIDRVAVGCGQPQTYGTQLRVRDDGGVVPGPIEDPERVDERRAARGMSTLAEYLRESADG